MDSDISIDDQEALDAITNTQDAEYALSLTKEKIIMFKPTGNSQVDRLNELVLKVAKGDLLVKKLWK